jgi:hypothetical protein
MTRTEERRATAPSILIGKMNQGIQVRLKGKYVGMSGDLKRSKAFLTANGGE